MVRTKLKSREMLPKTDEIALILDGKTWEEVNA